MTVADFFQERKVLHVARADLQAIGVFLDQVKIARVHDFGDDRQAGFAPGFGQETEPILAQPLEAVGRSPRFESAAAQNIGA